MYKVEDIKIIPYVRFQTPDGVVHETLAEALEHTLVYRPKYKLWATNKLEAFLRRMTLSRPGLSTVPITVPQRTSSMTARTRVILSMASMAKVGMSGTRTTMPGFACRKALSVCLRIFFSKRVGNFGCPFSYCFRRNTSKQRLDFFGKI